MTALDKQDSGDSNESLEDGVGNNVVVKNPVSNADAELIRQAEAEAAILRILVAAQLLKKVSDQSVLGENHRAWLHVAGLVEDVKDNLFKDSEDDGWIKQCALHGTRDTLIYYKVYENARMELRLDSVFEASLLVPVLSVFNESDLYSTWMPRWSFPRLGIQKSSMIKEFGRGHQVIQVVLDMPTPFSDRECLQHACAIDSIDEDEAIIFKVNSIEEEGKHWSGLEVGPVDAGVMRIFFDCGIVFRACPTDHPALIDSKHRYPEGERLILFSAVQTMDAHVSGVPLSLINFCTRHVFGRLMANMIKVAEEIRDGTRSAHVDAIAKKKDLYEWVEQRAQAMFDMMDKRTADPSG